MARPTGFVLLACLRIKAGTFADIQAVRLGLPLMTVRMSEASFRCCPIDNGEEKRIGEATKLNLSSCYCGKFRIDDIKPGR